MLSPMSETAQLFTPFSFFTVRSMPDEHAAHVIPVIEYFFSILLHRQAQFSTSTGENPPRTA